MRFSLAVAVVLAGISVSGVAQQNNTSKVRHSRPAAKADKKSAPAGKMAPSPATTSTAASRDLQKLERESARSSASARSAGQRTSGKAPALKPTKDGTNPPIKFGGMGSKSAGKTSRGSNPYKGRLKQKHAH